MSAFQPVGDTVALTVLAYQLYRKGYQVAKAAPDEFRSLLDELSIFKRTIWQVQKSLKDSDEILGEDIVAVCTNVLVKDFQPLVLKYEKLAFAERGQHWIRRFQFAADQDAIKAAYSRLDRAQAALQAWLTLDTRDSCMQYFETLKREIASQQQRQNSVEYRPLERIRTGASLDLAPVRSFDHRVDSLMGSEPDQYPSPPRVGRSSSGRNRTAQLPPEFSSPSWRNPLVGYPSTDAQVGASMSIASPRQTSLSIHSTVDTQSEGSEHTLSQNQAFPPIRRGSLQANDALGLPSDNMSDISGPTASNSADIKTSIVDEMFLRQFSRELSPRPELEEVFQKSVAEDLTPISDIEAWIYRAVWWVAKGHKIWSILNDPRLGLAATPFSSTTEWITENITLEQTIVDLMKAQFILHNIVLESLHVGDQITWASMRRLQDLSTAIKHGFVRESRGASLETSVLLKQRTSLSEAFVQPLETEAAMPAAIDTMDVNSRFLEVDEDIAGDQGEKVLYRTFVNAQIGDKGYARKSPHAPYLLVLWMQKYGADFEVSLLNQFGSLALNLSMGREEARKYDEELAAHGNDLRFDFPGQKAIVKFLSNANAQDFIARPRAFFEQVKDRYPRTDEFLVFRAGLHSSQGPRRVRHRTRAEEDQTQPSRPCEISLYNHVPTQLWKMTRRLVLCSIPNKRSTPQPFSKSVWLPLDRVRVSVTSREVKLLWSDCGHLEKRNLGDYREEFNYVYKANEPNQELHLVFKSAEVATEFANHILLPWETGFRLDGQIRNATTIHSLQPIKRETRIVVLRDLNAPENSGYFGLVLTQRNPNSHSHSVIHFAYADNDIKIDMSTFQAELSRLRQPSYISGFTNLTSIEPSTSLEQVSACRSISNTVGSESFHFDTFDLLQKFLWALTDWTFVWSRRARNIQLGSKGLRPASSAGPGEVQLWVKQRAAPWSNPYDVRLAVRVDDRGGGGGHKWYTTVLANRADLEQPKTTRVAIKFAREALQQGTLLDIRQIRASYDRQENDEGTTSHNDLQTKHSKLIIDFGNDQFAREIFYTAEAFFVPDVAAQAGFPFGSRRGG